MRATLGTRAGRSRGPLAWLVIASVLALSLLGGGSALAANPSWEVGHGTDSSLPLALQPASGASSSFVSAGEQVGFFEWLKNADTSNISQLYLTATTTPSATVVGANWTIKDADGVWVRDGTCPSATPLTCSLGSLNAGHTVYVVAAFNARANLADGSTQAVSFEFNTTGTPGGKNNSHGDAKVIEDSVGISSNGDAAGDFNFSQTSITVSDNLKLTGQNRQATSVTVTGVQIGAAVGDSPSLTTPCDTTLTVGFPSWFSCSLLTSLTSVVEVGNGKTFSNASGGPGIKVLITFSQSPNQLSGANPFVYHYWVDAAGVPHAELITTPCTPAGGLPSNTTPCLIVGNKQVTVWLFHNGPMRM